MLPTRIVLALLASAVMASAAPHHLVHRQDEGGTPTDGDATGPPPDVVEPTPDIVDPAPTPVDETPAGEETPIEPVTPTPDPDGPEDPGPTPSPTPGTQPFGSCQAVCSSHPFDDLLKCDDKVSDDCKTACAMSKDLETCSTCMSSDTTADAASHDKVKQWSDAAAFCPTGPTTPGPCDDKCKMLPDLQAACAPAAGGLYPYGCTGACPESWDDFAACEECYKTNGAVPIDVAGVFDSASFYCDPKGCYSTCEGVGGQITEHCTDEDSCKKNVCDGSSRSALDMCGSCLPNAPMDDKEWRDALYSDIGVIYDFCHGGGPLPDNCAEKCSDILDLDYESCKNLNPTECAAMCADKNLGAFEQCATCAKDSKASVYDPQSLNDLFNSRRDWCKGNKDTGGPPITVTVDATITVVVPNRPPPTPISPNNRPTGKVGGIAVNTSRPVATSRRPSGSTRPTSSSSATELPLGFGGMGFGAALGLVMGVLVVVV